VVVALFLSTNQPKAVTMQIDSNRLFDFTGFRFENLGVIEEISDGTDTEKPYWSFWTLSEEEEKRFNAYMADVVEDAREKILAYIEGLRRQNISGFPGAGLNVFMFVPVGRTLDDEMVLLTFYGNEKEPENIHWHCYRCPDDELENLHWDLEKLFKATLWLVGDPRRRQNPAPGSDSNSKGLGGR
jgi:hypothetical protein